MNKKITNKFCETISVLSNYKNNQVKPILEEIAENSGLELRVVPHLIVRDDYSKTELYDEQLEITRNSIPLVRLYMNTTPTDETWVDQLITTNICYSKITDGILADNIVEKLNDIPRVDSGIKSLHIIKRHDYKKAQQEEFGAKTYFD